MKLSKHLLLLSLMLLAACASTPKPETKKTTAKPQQTHVALERMDAPFLYMAAQRALGQGQTVLGIRFLKALLRKDAAAVEPRLELVALLLGNGKVQQWKQAKLLLEQMPEAVLSSLAAKPLARYQFYYAKTLLVLGDTNKAFVLLDKLLKRAPDDIQVRQMLVRLHVLNKEFPQAEDLLRQGIATFDDIRLRQMQVAVLLQQKKFKLADRALVRMQKKYPDHEDVVLQRSQLAEQQGKPLQAERHLKRYIALHSEVAVLSSAALAALYTQQERFPEAIATYQKMLPMTAGSAEVYMSLGRIYYQMGDYNLAVAVFGESVLKLSQGRDAEAVVPQALAAAYFYLAASLEASHAWQEAVPVYQQLTPKHVHYLDAQLRLVNIEISQKDEKAAEARLFRLKTLFAHNVEVYEVLSGLRLQQKAYDVLLTETQQGLDLGFSSMLLFNRAIAFDALKDFDKLDEALNILLKQEPEHVETLNFYGYSLAERGIRLDDAQAMVQKALKIKPDDGYYLDSLAWVYFKQKKYKQALKLQLKAVEKISDDPVMQEHLGDMYWRVGKQAQAKRVWQASMALKPAQAAVIQQKIEFGLK